jgi:hypothetical protein
MTRETNALRLASTIESPQAHAPAHNRVGAVGLLHVQAMPSLMKVCDSDRVECPKCGGVIRRIRPVLGSLLAYCENRHPTRHGEKCGQHVHVLGAPEGVCIVRGITREQFDQARAAGVRAVQLYRELGDL